MGGRVGEGGDKEEGGEETVQCGREWGRVREVGVRVGGEEEKGGGGMGGKVEIGGEEEWGRERKKKGRRGLEGHVVYITMLLIILAAFL